MQKRIVVLATLLALLAANGYAQKKSKAKVKPKPAAGIEMVEISTDYGNMYFTLYDQTPLHRDNFKKLIREKFYDSLLFHRVINGFMIQGGDPESKRADSAKMLGNGGPGYTIPAEIKPYIIHKKGALAAARLGDNMNPEKESSGSQFYIVQGKTYTRSELEQLMNNKNLNKKQQLLYKVMMSDSMQQKIKDVQAVAEDEASTSFISSLPKGTNMNDSLRNLLNTTRQKAANLAARNFIMKMQPMVEQLYQKNVEFVYSIPQVDTYAKAGGTPHLDMDYTVFGEMVSGWEVLDKIAAVQTGQANRPLKDVRMKIRLVRK